jgi:hypothetical protein
MERTSEYPALKKLFGFYMCLLEKTTFFSATG